MVTLSDVWLHCVRYGYSGLHKVTLGYISLSGLHAVAVGYIFLYWFKHVHSGLHMVTPGYMFIVGYIWLH